ncbi:BatA and WFA domain-containing protein [Planctomycetota bacterium]|nr:BatA and WFA domain-containing protein [Planctomycetota bacterium]
MTTLSAISLTTPAMLTGLFLLSLPIIVHFLNRRAKRTVVFPSIELLLNSTASQSNISKLKRLLLLLLRVLAVTLIVFAFTRPFHTSNSTEQDTVNNGAGVVLLIDVSASSAQQTTGISALKSLSSAASKSLNSLLAGSDTANIIFASANPKTLFPGMSSNLTAIKNELSSIKPTAERANLVAALGLANQQLSDQFGTRHLIILTDLQQTNWNEIASNSASNSNSLTKAFTSLPRDTKITIMPLNDKAPSNLALSSPSSYPAAPLTNRLTSLSVIVNNFSPHIESNRVTLIVDGHTFGSTEVEIPAWSNREVAFHTTFEKSGEHTVSFHINDDALNVDNQAHLVVACAKRVPVLIIGDEPVNSPGNATYFLTRALAPRNNEHDSYQITLKKSTQVAPTDINQASVVFISEILTLPDSLASSLYAYMNSGGAVVMFSGSTNIPKQLETLNKLREDDTITPWQVSSRRDLTPRNDHLNISPDGNWRNNMLKVFDPTSQQSLSKINFSRVWSTSKVHQDTRILLKYNDGSPALGDRIIGNGRFLLATFSPSLADSDLSKYGSFVALIQNITSALQSSKQINTQTFCGSSVTILPTFELMPSEDSVFVTDPDDNTITDCEIALDGDTPAINIGNTQTPGIYSVKQGSHILTQVAINIDPRESDLRRVDRKKLQTSLTATGLTAQLADATSAQPLNNLRGTPLWGYLILLAMIALAIEMSLLSYWKR